MCRTCCKLLIVVAAWLAPGAVAEARAAWLGYSNDTQTPVVVQVSAIIGNQERRGQPRAINPRERNFEPIAIPNVKVLILRVYDPQLRPLGQFPINFVGRDMFYSIQADAVGGGLDKKPIVRIVEIRLAMPGAGMPGAMPGFQPGFPGKLPGAMPAVPPVPVPGSTATPIPPKKN